MLCYFNKLWLSELRNSVLCNIEYPTDAAIQFKFFETLVISIMRSSLLHRPPIGKHVCNETKVSNQMLNQPFIFFL